MEPTIAVFQIKTQNPIKTGSTSSTPTLKVIFTPSPTKTNQTPSLTVDATQQSWRATAEVIATADKLHYQKSAHDKATQVALFPSTCEDMNLFASSISIDGKWFAASCGYKRNQTLSVQSKNGTHWVVNFKEILGSAHPEGIMGALYPISWSPEGSFLFFSIGLGYSGGGNDCFPHERGRYGLFRLNLSSGSWTTIIPFTDSFPGYEIEFSPTGLHYAITLNGVLVSNLQTGDFIKLVEKETVQKLSWSPNGRYLAYSIAKCDTEEVISSTVYVWDSITKQKKTLIEINGIILAPESWVDASTLRIFGGERKDLELITTIYEYRTNMDNVLFLGTTTPSP